MQPKGIAIRKRSQIAHANRTMFIWVAIVSAVLGFALVGSIFLTQKLFFNERVLAEKQKTVDTLKANNAAVSSLENQIRVLDTNQALISSKAQPSDQAVQVILDALPSDANSLALGASLQNKLLSGIPGLVLNSLQVTPVSGIETSDTSSSSTPTDTTSSNNAITFSFSVTGSQAALKQVLTNLERSIRAIDITSIQLASQDANTQTITVQGQAFYEPAVVVQLKDKTVK